MLKINTIKEYIVNPQRTEISDASFTLEPAALELQHSHPLIAELFPCPRLYLFLAMQLPVFSPHVPSSSKVLKYNSQRLQHGWHFRQLLEPKLHFFPC